MPNLITPTVLLCRLFSQPVEQRLTVVTLGVFLDPDGYPWEVAHSRHWTIDQDGSVKLAA